jgi:hypothetical protein
MRFIETPIFTRAIVALLDDEAYRLLQLALLQRPARGAVIRGSGGLRKLRWSIPGQGKRGSLRIIYFWDEASATCYLLYAYPKNAQEDLTARQLRVLSRLVREEFG